MCGLVIQTITAFGKHIRVKFRIHERNRDLAHSSFFGNGETGFLVIRLHRVDPARVGVSLSVDLVPCAVEVVAELAIFLDGSHFHHLVLAEVMDFIGTEIWLII